MVARYEAHDSSKDAAEWPSTINRYWFADTVVKVKYNLTVDVMEAAALESVLRNCLSVAIQFTRH